MFGVLGNMRNDFPAISDSRTRSSPAKPRELVPRPWPDREQGAKTSNAKGIEPEAPFRTPTRQKRATRIGDMQKAADRPAKPAQEAPNAKRPPAPEGAGGLSSSRRRGGRPQTKGGTPSGPPSQAPCPRIPAPSPAQRAPGAGGALVSHRVAPAVPSALAGLTSGFGMGPGVPRPPGPPAPGGRCGAGSEGAGLRSGRPGGRTALKEGAL